MWRRLGKNKMAAYKKRKEEEEKRRAAEIAKLEAEGKSAEAAAEKLKQTQAEAEALRKKNIELTRDNELSRIMGEHKWRNSQAQDMAYRTIVSELVQDANGQWVHKTGKSVKDYVSAFVTSEDNAFLMQPKQSSGLGGGQPPAGGTPTEKKSIFSMSQAEVLKLAAEGKLPGGNPGIPW